MDYVAHVDAVGREGAALARAARRAGTDAPVPACGAWSVGDLLRHQGLLHHWVASLVEHRPSGDRSLRDRIAPPPDGPELLAWFDAGVERLVAALRSCGPEEEVWSWADERTAAFWARRMAHETATHRVDAEQAAGTHAQLAPALAVDGIDELLRLARLPFGRHATGNGEIVHLHSTDVAGEWLVTLRPDGPEVRHEHAKGDVAARGPASDLLLGLVGREPLERLEVFGDRALLERTCEMLRT